MVTWEHLEPVPSQKCCRLTAEYSVGILVKPLEGLVLVMVLRNIGTLKGSWFPFYYLSLVMPLPSVLFLGPIVYDLDDKSETNLSRVKFGCTRNCRDQY